MYINTRSSTSYHVSHRNPHPTSIAHCNPPHINCHRNPHPATAPARSSPAPPRCPSCRTATRPSLPPLWRAWLRMPPDPLPGKATGRAGPPPAPRWGETAGGWRYDGYNDSLWDISNVNSNDQRQRVKRHLQHLAGG